MAKDEAEKHSCPLDRVDLRVQEQRTKCDTVAQSQRNLYTDLPMMITFFITEYNSM